MGKGMNVENVIELNSNTVIAKVHEDNFINEITEIEKIAEYSGVYGKVTKYSVKKEGNYYNVMFNTL